jgi:hypothetical protein
MALKVEYTDLPAFYFDTVSMRLGCSSTSITARLRTQAFESIGHFFSYADRTYDCIVLFQGLKSFKEIGALIVTAGATHPNLISVRYYGFKKFTSTSKYSLKNFF